MLFFESEQQQRIPNTSSAPEGGHHDILRLSVFADDHWTVEYAMGDAFSWRVMISSTMQDLPRERELAERVITSEGLTPWYAERPPAELTGSAYDLSRTMAQTCDLYLLIVGLRYGSHPAGMPADDPRSVTHLEFDLAHAANPRKIRVFLPHDALALAESDAQRQFVAQVTAFRNGYDCFTYDRADLRTLEEQIRHAIRQWRDTAGRDTYCVTMRDTYHTERNPVTGAEMDANASVLLKLRAEVLATSRGGGAAWDEQLDEEDARLYDEPDSARRGLGERRRRRGRRPKQADGDANASAKAQIQERARPIIAQVNDFLVQFGRLVLLGEVGAGKSTLLRRLAYAMAQEALSAQDTAPSRLPILVRATDLGRVALERPHEHAAEVAGLLAERLTANASLKPLYHAVVAEALYRGTALLMVDGLDEALPAEQQAVFAVLRGLEANQVVLASRPAAYHEELSGATWRVCQVQRLDPDQRRALITAVFRAVTAGDPGPDDNTPLPNPELLERELEQRSDLFVWAGNPLLLTLIATQYARDARLPESRGRIYQFAIEDMRRQRSTSARRYFTEEELDRLQRELALRMTEAGTRLTTLGEARDRFLGELLRDMAPDSTLATRDACAREALDRSGVLQQVDAEQWEFVHLSFREYLAACALAAVDHRARWQVMRTHARNAQWEQVFFLLVSRLDTERHESQTDALIRALIALDRAHVPALGGPDPTHAALRLATRCFFSRQMRARNPRLRAALVTAWRPLWRGMLWRTTMQSTIIPFFDSYGEFEFNTDPEHLSPGTLLLPTTGHWIHWVNRNSEGNNLGCLLALTMVLAVVSLPLLFVYVVVGHLALSIPGASQSGVGQWLVSSLPPFTLGLLLLYAGLRVLLQRWQQEDHAEEALIQTLARDTLEPGAVEAVTTPALTDMLLRRVNTENEFTAGYALGAVAAAAGSAADEIIAQLLPQMPKLDAWGRWGRPAIAAFERLGPTVADNEPVMAKLLALLQARDYWVRHDTLDALGAVLAQGPAKSSNEAVIAGMLACVEDHEEIVRKAAVRALSRIGPAAAGTEVVTTRLPALLKHESCDVRAAAQKLLVAWRPEAVIAALLASLHDPDQNVRRDAVWAFRGLGSPAADNEALAESVAHLKDPDKYARGSALSWLGEWVASDPTRTGADAVVARLLACLEDEDEWVRLKAVETLERLMPVIPDREFVVTRLQARLNDWGEDGLGRVVCVTAARALGPGVAGTDAVVTGLLTRLEDRTNKFARGRAAHNLGELGPGLAGTEPVIAVLLACLKDPDVRGSVAAALGKLAAKPGAAVNEAVIAALLACLEDGDKYIRQSAVKGLGALGPRLWEHQAVVDALVTHLRHTDSDVSRAVEDVIAAARPQAVGIVVLAKVLLTHLERGDGLARAAVSRAFRSAPLLDSIPTSSTLARRVRTLAVRPRWWWVNEGLVLVQRLCDWPVVVCAIAAQTLVIWPALTRVIHFPAPVYAMFGLTTWWQILLLMVGYLAINSGLAYISLSLAESQAEQRNVALELLERLLGRIDESRESSR